MPLWKWLEVQFFATPGERVNTVTFRGSSWPGQPCPRFLSTSVGEPDGTRSYWTCSRSSRKCVLKPERRTPALAPTGHVLPVTNDKGSREWPHAQEPQRAPSCACERVRVTVPQRLVETVPAPTPPPRCTPSCSPARTLQGVRSG